MAYLPKDFEIAKTVSKGHGRLETRTLTVSSQLKDFLDGPYLEQVFKLERCFVSTRTGQVHQQVVYGITRLSRDQITPQRLLAMIRSYWGIESGLHYRRDVSLHEDHTRMTQPNAARARARLTNLVLGVLLAKKRYPYIPAARGYFNPYYPCKAPG
jgi:hypothetical protein